MHEDTIFILNGDGSNSVVIPGHHDPRWVIPLEKNNLFVTVPEFFDEVKIYRLGYKVWIRFLKRERMCWLKLKGKVLDDYTRVLDEYKEMYVNITMEEDYEIADVILSVEVTFKLLDDKNNEIMIHGPTAKIEMSDFGL